MSIADFGIYSYAMALTGLMIVPGNLGFQQVVTRDVARYVSKKQWSFLKGLLIGSAGITFLTVLFLFFVSTLIINNTEWGRSLPNAQCINTAFFLVMIVPFVELCSDTFIGLNYPELSLIPLVFLRPVSFLLLIFAAYILGHSLSPQLTMVLQISGTLIAFISALVLMYYLLPRDILSVKPEYQMGIWIKSALPFLLVGGMHIINSQTDIIMLGAMTNEKEVAYYRIAQRSAEFVHFGWMAMTIALSPIISDYHSNNKIGELQLHIKRYSFISFLFGSGIAMVGILFGRQLLPLVFGLPYSNSYWPFVILCMAYLVRSTLGASETLLNMTGNEKLTAYAYAFGALSNVILNAVLIPVAGANGAAAATGISLCLWNVFLSFRCLGILALSPSFIIPNIRVKRGTIKK
jgi:O-antigen/teichoic acid export membrane protein